MKLREAPAWGPLFFGSFSLREGMRGLRGGDAMGRGRPSPFRVGRPSR
jgi:hypothetical protein